jgi:hypothetical protein
VRTLLTLSSVAGSPRKTRFLMDENWRSHDESSNSNDSVKFQNRHRSWQSPEARAVKNELGSFEVDSSRASQLISELFTWQIRMRELKLVVESAREYLRTRKGKELPPLSRSTKRSKDLLTKYIDDHFADLAPVLSAADIEDSENKPLYPRFRQVISLPTSHQYRV